MYFHISTLVHMPVLYVASCNHACMVAISNHVKYLTCNHKHMAVPQNTDKTENCILCSKWSQHHLVPKPLTKGSLREVENWLVRLKQLGKKGNFSITKTDKTRPHADMANVKKSIKYHANIIEYNSIYHICGRLAVQLSKHFQSFIEPICV